MSTIPSLLALFLAFATTSAYSSTLETRAGNSVIATCQRGFAYTFDNGPYLWEDEIVDAFDCAAAKTTFFVNGNSQSCIYSEDNVQRLRYAFEAGHQIASGGWSNADFSSLSNAQIDVEVQRLDEAIIKILGVKPKVFRAKSISDDAATYITTKYGKTVVSSDKDDSSAGTTGQSLYQFYQGVVNEGQDHPHLGRSDESKTYALDALDLGTVELFTVAGVRLFTVAECLNIAPYEVIGNYGFRDASWTCDGSWSPPSAPTCAQTYTAVATDKTCAAIATKFGVTAQSLYLANPFLNCQDVWAWTPVCIPAAPTTLPQTTCAQRYNTVAGDTCAKLAVKFGTTTEKLFAANTFVTCNDIWAGTPLCIPAPTTPTSTTSASTTPASTTSASTTPASTPVTCSTKYSSVAGDNCASIGTLYGLSADAIKNANSFLNCADIWANTPICIPSGGTNCVSQYSAGDNETCITVGNKFGLSATAIYNANTFVGCDNIWKNTPLCIPPGGRGCTNTINSWPGATCDTIASAYGKTSANIKLWNSFVNCNDIWTNTPICVAH